MLKMNQTIYAVKQHNQSFTKFFHYLSFYQIIKFFIYMKEYSIKTLIFFYLLVLFVDSFNSKCIGQLRSNVIDISNSKILKSTLWEYNIVLFNNQFNYSVNQFGQLDFTGNFSTIRLKSNDLNKNFIYQAKKMILRFPGMYQYSKNKSAQLEIQLVYDLNGNFPQNTYKKIIMSQLYVQTKFLSKVDISISKEINGQLKNGGIFPIKKILKIISGTPVLMYKGLKKANQCLQNDLLIIRKQFVLISQTDINELKRSMNFKQNLMPKNRLRIQKMYQISQLRNDNQDPQQKNKKQQDLLL